MEQNNRKYIALIAFLRKFISVFFSLFFNVYILKIVNNDLNFILKYTVFSVILGLIFEYVVLKIINSKNAKIIYQASFPLLVICIITLMVFKEKIVNYIFIFKAIHTLATICYSAPYELMIIGSNSNKTMSTFLANLIILESITTILTPIFSGFIIDTFSYYTFFVFLVLEAILIILVSLKIKNVTVSDKKMKLKEFWSKAKKRKPIKDIYNCMFFRRISTQGAMTELLPIILFLKLGTELDLGAYNSFFAILSIMSLQILKWINRKNIEKKFYPYLAIVIFISSVFVVYNSSFTTLLIYYILMNTFGAVIESEACSAVYAVVTVDNLAEYRKEHIFTYNIYMTIGQLISYGLVYVLYNYFYNVNILSITVAVLMFFLIISTIYLRKTQRYLYEVEKQRS